jgi:hypothetical protein
MLRCCSPAVALLRVCCLTTGTCLPSRCPETALVYPPISLSLHSNGSTQYNIFVLSKTFTGFWNGASSSTRGWVWLLLVTAPLSGGGGWLERVLSLTGPFLHTHTHTHTRTHAHTHAHTHTHTHTHACDVSTHTQTTVPVNRKQYYVPWASVVIIN